MNGFCLIMSGEYDELFKIHITPLEGIYKNVTFCYTDKNIKCEDKLSEYMRDITVLENSNKCLEYLSNTTENIESECIKKMHDITKGRIYRIQNRIRDD
jgi:pantothenate kinase